MSAARLIASSLRVAREDLAGARVLASAGNRNAVYLCEQAAEKLIVAVLTSEGLRGNIKHQLDAMVDLVPDENPIKPALRSIEKLAAYATTFRYPTPSGRVAVSPSRSEVLDLADKVEGALSNAAERFGVDLDAADTPARRPEPIR